MTTERQLIFYKHYFTEFYLGQTTKVQEKIDYVFKILRTVDKVPRKFLDHMTGTEGLYEIRIEVGSNIYRVFCCFDKGNLVVLFKVNKAVNISNTMTIRIRKAIEGDSEKLWTLMKELAIFEKYIDSFAITPEIVRENGFRKKPHDFYCIVAENNDEIVGMLVYYFLPYTAQNRPAIYMKELYVDESYRGQKIGEQLMDVLRKEAELNNCGQIKWTVAPWNEKGKKFYEKIGAKENRHWLNYELNL